VLINDNLINFKLLFLRSFQVVLSLFCVEAISFFFIKSHIFYYFDFSSLSFTLFLRDENIKKKYSNHLDFYRSLYLFK